MRLLLLVVGLLISLGLYAKIDGVSGNSNMRKHGSNWVSDFLRDKLNTHTPSIVVLSWDYPTLREDGSALALNEIKEYRIYEGLRLIARASGEVKTINVDTHIGTHYYSISTVTIDDVEGNKSSLIQVIVN